MKNSQILENLFLVLPTITDYHASNTKLYSLLEHISRKEINNLFLNEKPLPVEFKPFGQIIFPYYNMGAINSLNLFGIDELIIFSFYWQNRKKYRNVIDLGANIGLHSIILSKCVTEVRAYEPDPQHFKVLQRNLSLNNCFNTQIFNVAVSDMTGTSEFIRVLDNTTSSHIAGAKVNPYGELKKFTVKTEAIEPLMDWADLIKLDVEGQEKKIVLATDRKQWLTTDALIEIENEDNARAIYSHFTGLDVNLFSQKNNWQKIEDIEDMPFNYREGTLFATCKKTMPWR